MARRIIDLSVALESGIKSDPPSMLPQIQYVDHKAGFGMMGAMFPGLKLEQMIGGEAGAVEGAFQVRDVGRHAVTREQRGSHGRAKRHDMARGGESPCRLAADR